MGVLRFNNRGQTLIEALVALTSVILTLTAISIAVTTSVSNSTFVKNQTTAARYAQEGMEYMRYLRNTDPANFFALSGIQCFNSDGSFNPHSACTSINIANAYKREATFTQGSASCGTSPEGSSNNGTKVAVAVYFTSNKCPPVAGQTLCHKSELVSCFSKTSSVIPTL